MLSIRQMVETTALYNPPAIKGRWRPVFVRVACGVYVVIAWVGGRGCDRGG